LASTLSATILPQITTVSANTTYQFTITTPDPITSAGIITITFPSSIQLAFTSSNCASVSGASTNPNPTCAKSGNTLIISNLNLTNSIFPAMTFNINVSGIINPPSTKPSLSFTISTYYTASLSSLVSTFTGNPITATAATLNSALASITPSSYVAGDSGVTFTITFTTSNTIPIGGSVVIGIPKVITTAIGSVSSSCYY